MIFHALLDLIFPPTCEVCRRPGPEALCSNCFAQIKFLKPYLGVYCASVYQGALKTAIFRLKFQKRKKMAEPLGILMVRYLSQAPGMVMEEIDCVVPVPLHQRRLAKRGFNQAELLAHQVGRYFEKPVHNALLRYKETQPQFELPAAARRRNVSGVFRVAAPHLVRGQRVLLLDDILTTGSTAAECARVLKEAGARRVEIAALARAL